MSVRGLHPVLLAVAVALAVSCEKEPLPTSPGPRPTGIPLPTVMTVCAYTVVAADTLEIIAPAQLMCDSAGTPNSLPADTVRSWFAVAGDSFEVSLKDVSPVIRRIMAGPSFSSEVVGFLDMLESVTLSITGVFLRVEGQNEMQGLWRFAGLKPTYISEYLRQFPVLYATLNSMIVDPDGRASMMFRFSADTLWGLLSRRAYGEAVLDGQLDTVTYSVRDVFRADSTWHIVGGVSADTVMVIANGDGDMLWVWADSTHEYRQFPAQCPNPVTPPWFASFLLPNQH